MIRVIDESAVMIVALDKLTSKSIDYVAYDHPIYFVIRR